MPLSLMYAGHENFPTNNLHFNSLISSNFYSLVVCAQYPYSFAVSYTLRDESHVQSTTFTFATATVTTYSVHNVLRFRLRFLHN